MQDFGNSIATASGPDEWNDRYATLSGEIESIEKQLWHLGSPILFADAMNLIAMKKALGVPVK